MMVDEKKRSLISYVPLEIGCKPPIGGFTLRDRRSVGGRKEKISH